MVANQLLKRKQLPPLWKISARRGLKSASSDWNRTVMVREIESLREMEQELNNLETQLADFQSVSPDVLVAPFNSRAESLQGISLTPTGFFAPAVSGLALAAPGGNFLCALHRARAAFGHHGIVQDLALSPDRDLDREILELSAVRCRNGCCHHGYGCLFS